ncbi:MAG TPA: hypothetical protein VNO30_15375 [Kofleriaceae bacterium]|nr:hypothetical protein [Kofleriaceae bacterium]
MASEAEAPDRIPTRTACVIAGATPAQVAAVGTSERIWLRENRLGTLVSGRPGDLVIDYAAELPGPVYDVMYNAGTGWFAVTIYRGLTHTTRWDNRPGTNAGYPRVGDVLGATTPLSILVALDVSSAVLGYAEA